MNPAAEVFDEDPSIAGPAVSQSSLTFLSPAVEEHLGPLACQIFVDVLIGAFQLRPLGHHSAPVPIGGKFHDNRSWFGGSRVRFSHPVKPVDLVGCDRRRHSHD